MYNVHTNQKCGRLKIIKKKFLKILSDKATINQKLADKRKKRIDAVNKLQKEETLQTKKLAKQQQDIFTAYERQIDELTKQIRIKDSIPEEERYIYENDTMEEYDVFVSHSTEDKESLESSSQPLGVSAYELSKLIPENFKGSLPSIDEIESELQKDVDD